MTYLWFVLVQLPAAGLVAALRVVGIRLRFETTFRFLAISVTMLPMLVMSALLWWPLGMGLALVVLMGLYVDGFDLSAIPHRYEVLGLLALAAATLCVSALPWIKYVLIVYREGK